MAPNLHQRRGRNKEGPPLQHRRSHHERPTGARPRICGTFTRPFGEEVGGPGPIATDAAAMTPISCPPAAGSPRPNNPAVRKGAARRHRRTTHTGPTWHSARICGTFTAYLPTDAAADQAAVAPPPVHPPTVSRPTRVAPVEAVRSTRQPVDQVVVLPYHRPATNRMPAHRSRTLRTLPPAPPTATWLHNAIARSSWPRCSGTAIRVLPIPTARTRAPPTDPHRERSSSFGVRSDSSWLAPCVKGLSCRRALRCVALRCLAARAGIDLEDPLDPKTDSTSPARIKGRRAPKDRSPRVLPHATVRRFCDKFGKYREPIGWTRRRKTSSHIEPRIRG